VPLIESPEAMHELGVALSRKLQAGDLVILAGPLGAGKTALTQGIGAGLGVTGITSPTFVISKVYPGRLPLIHVDAYRLLDSATQGFEFDDLDLDTAREAAVTVIEWGSDVAPRLGEDYLKIELSFGDLETQRRVEVVGHGDRWRNFKL